MKFNRSRDGKRRATVIVKFRVDLDMLAVAGAIAMYNDSATDDDIADAGARLTRAKVEQQLRDTLYNRGLDGIDWPVEDSMMAECLDTAPDFVAALFPELAQVTA